MRNKDVLKIYKCRKWKVVRKEQLKRDRNECQRCKHAGKYKNVEGMKHYTKAVLVHHEFRVSRYPQYAYMATIGGKRNLYSLCNECHEIEHEEERGLVKTKQELNEERW